MLDRTACSGAGAPEVGEEDTEVTTADGSIAVEVTDAAGLAPEGDQDAEVTTIDDTVAVEVARGPGACLGRPLPNWWPVVLLHGLPTLPMPPVAYR